MWQRFALMCIFVGLVGACQWVNLPNEQSDLGVSQESWLAAATDWAARQPRPAQRIVDRIEALLAGQQCVGRLDRWSRSYAYHYDPRTGNLYDKIIDFHLEEAGSRGIRAGRHVTGPTRWMWVDDRPIKMATGDYDVTEGRLRIAYCGDNMGPPEDFDRFERYWDDLERRRSALAPTREHDFPPGMEAQQQPAQNGS